MTPTVSLIKKGIPLSTEYSFLQLTQVIKSPQTYKAPLQIGQAKISMFSIICSSIGNVKNVETANAPLALKYRINKRGNCRGLR